MPPAPPPAEPLNAPRTRADLFWSFTWLALQGFGGVLAVVQRELVEKKRWLSREQFIEDWAVAQIMPGPNVVNLSMMIGDRHFGLSGALAALAGMLVHTLAVALGLATLFAGVSEVIATYQPVQTAVEIVFVNVNPQSTLLLGQARGAAISALVHGGLPVAEYTALQVKQAVVGHGKADKEQVQAMVVRLLNLPGVPGADAADALACAICHAHAGEGLGLIGHKVAGTPGGKLKQAGYRIRGGRLIG